MSDSLALLGRQPVLTLEVRSAVGHTYGLLVAHKAGAAVSRALASPGYKPHLGPGHGTVAARQPLSLPVGVPWHHPETADSAWAGPHPHVNIAGDVVNLDQSHRLPDDVCDGVGLSLAHCLQVVSDGPQKCEEGLTS